MAENEIIERICGSCGCDEATAKEYLNDEIRHLRELQEVEDLQESDIELSCRSFTSCSSLRWRISSFRYSFAVASSQLHEPHILSMISFSAIAVSIKIVI